MIDRGRRDTIDCWECQAKGWVWLDTANGNCWVCELPTTKRLLKGHCVEAPLPIVPMGGDAVAGEDEGVPLLKRKFPRYFTSVNREFSLDGSSSRADFRFSRSGCRRRELPAVVSWRLALRRAAFVTHARGEQVESLDRSARRARVRRVIRASVVAEVPPPRNRGPGDKCRVGRHGQEQDKDQEVRGGQACTEPQGGARGQGQENEEEARRRARSETHVRLPLPHLAAARAEIFPR